MRLFIYLLHHLVATARVGFVFPDGEEMQAKGNARTRKRPGLFNLKFNPELRFKPHFTPNFGGLI